LHRPANTQSNSVADAGAYAGTDAEPNAGRI
jgi:hypothetical protein